MLADASRPSTSPAYVLDRQWNARGWNAAAERLFTAWLDRGGERNLLRFIFLEPRARRLHLPTGMSARAAVVAEFRAHFGRISTTGACAR